MKINKYGIPIVAEWRGG